LRIATTIVTVTIDRFTATITTVLSTGGGVGTIDHITIAITGRTMAGIGPIMDAVSTGIGD
jgi:hypothetical protein